MKQRLALAVIAGLAVAAGPAAPAGADAIRDDEWHLRYLNVAEANQHSRGEGVTVAIVDRGIDRTHDDLAGAVLDPVHVTLGDGLPAPSDGPTTGPADVINPDPDGHGTALAGVIAGQGHGVDRADGVIGVAPGAKLLPVMIDVPAERQPGPDDLAAGIEVAIKHRASVIVVGYSVAGSERLMQAVRDAQAADAIVVAADGDQLGRAFEPFPAAYEGVLAAVPLTRVGTVRVQSTSGRRLGLGVPGFQIMTTNSGNRYRVDDGSASPGLLAGAVALLRAAHPDVKSGEIIRRLRLTAVDAGAPGTDAEYGLGRLNLVEALVRRLPPPSPAPSASPSDPGASPAAAPVAAPPRPRSREGQGWLLALPLFAVIAGLGWYAGRAERRIRLSARKEVDSVGVQS
jgi:subtilisin family serine protease